MWSAKASLRREHLSRDPKGEDPATRHPRGSVCRAEGAGSTDVPREAAWPVLGTAEGPVGPGTVRDGESH